MYERWTSLVPYWSLLSHVAAERERQKNDFESTRNYAKRPHFVGLCGELVYAIGRDKELNADLLINGDGHKDFTGVSGKRVDIKTTTHWDKPLLLWDTNYERKAGPADVLVLGTVDMDKRRGALVGWCLGEKILTAPQLDFGYGNRHFIEGGELCRFPRKRPF